MSRVSRQLLFFSLIACHAAVVLCGPCLHALPGSTHEMGAASKSHRADHPLKSRSDSNDDCLICQFVAQGQLPVEFSPGSSPQIIGGLIISALPVANSFSNLLRSCPRAPPMVLLGLS